MKKGTVDTGIKGTESPDRERRRVEGIALKEREEMGKRNADQTGMSTLYNIGHTYVLKVIYMVNENYKKTDRNQ